MGNFRSKIQTIKKNQMGVLKVAYEKNKKKLRMFFNGLNSRRKNQIFEDRSA